MMEGDRNTAIVCQGTSCENTVCDIVMDVITYGIYLACVVAGFLVVYPNVGMVVRVMVWVAVAGIAFVVGLRYVKWLRRLAAIKAGVARIQAEAVGAYTQAATSSPLQAVAVKVSLPPVKFRHTAKFAAMGSSSGEVPCAICLAPLVPGDVVNELACGHCYHSACMAAWITAVQSATCPECRAPVGGAPCGAQHDVEMAKPPLVVKPIPRA